jgi:hypothetical protein
VNVDVTALLDARLLNIEGSFSIMLKVAEHLGVLCRQRKAKKAEEQASAAPRTQPQSAF